MSKNPKLSIVITTYNRLNFLKQALQSVLNQSYRNYEIIIIDDCSTYETYEWINSLKYENLYYVRNNVNRGVGFNRKYGYLKSRGNYIIFMDDDDYYIDNDFFLKSINILEERNNLNLAFVSGNANILMDSSNELIEKKLKLKGYVNNVDYLINFQDTYSKPFSTFTTIFNKDYLEKSNFSEMKMVNDSSIYLRALLVGGAYILYENIGVYRVHNSNLSKMLKVDFIIDNLREKRLVLKQMKIQNIKTNYSTWWFKQLYITLTYYISDSDPSIRDIFKILLWMYKNTESSRYRCITLVLKIYFKKHNI